MAWWQLPVSPLTQGGRKKVQSQTGQPSETLPQNEEERAFEMAQRRKALATQTDELSSIPRTHIVEGQSQLLHSVL